MESNLIISILPAIVVGVVAWLITKKFFEEQTKKRELELRILAQKDISPIRLQAYERIALFLERIKPTSLILRFPHDVGIDEYEHLLLKTINEEYNHNIAQRIYINPDTWENIFTAKNGAQEFIRNTKSGLNDGAGIVDFKIKLIENSTNVQSVLENALFVLQKDIQGL